jgi:pantothenate synthetase
MAGNSPSVKQMTEMINRMMGQRVLTEQQLNQILAGAKRANERGGMAAVLDYLMKVTQADVDKQELQDFAQDIQRNPQLGMDFLQGKRNVPRSRNRRR